MEATTFEVRCSDGCDDWWHTFLTSPPQTYTAEQVREYFNQKRKES
jgi:hypothetical protein